jgi:hypothetical protein
MKKHLSVAAFVLAAVVSAAPIFAQAPKGWMMRSDHSMNASDPDASGSVNFVEVGKSFRAKNPMAAIYWNPANTMGGDYTVKGKFTMLKTEGFNEYYGLIFGGSGLDGQNQSYLYFMVSDDGTYLIKRRNGNSTEGVSQKTPNAVVQKAGANGQCTNELEVRVKANKIDFVINGTVVDSVPKTGPTAKTDGIYGIRVNHRLEVQIDDFGASKM